MRAVNRAFGEVDAFRDCLKHRVLFGVNRARTVSINHKAAYLGAMGGTWR